MSSSGSGVATAAGLCFASIGTDTGGSNRMPSSANGVVGLKPTYGRVSRYGVLPMAPSLDHVPELLKNVVFSASAVNRRLEAGTTLFNMFGSTTIADQWHRIRRL